MKIGDKLPAFKLQDQHENWIDSHSLLGKPFVIYFYPKDETSVCTIEACSFRDNFQDFQDEGAQVLGVSADSPAAHARFATKHRLPFVLLSDKGNQLRKLFKVPRNFLGLIPGRVTYVFNAEGLLKHSFSSQLKPKQHVEEALKILKEF